MTSRARTLTLLLILVGALTVAATALASPDGDDDPTYNAGSGFGTRYTLLPSGQFDSHTSGARPVTDQAPDGSSVTAVLMHIHTGNESANYGLHLSRLGIDGKPTGFGTTLADLPGTSEETYRELLDIRVLSDGRFVVLARRSESNGNALVAATFTAAGTSVSTTTYIACGLGEVDPPKRIAVAYDNAELDAARVEADGHVSSLWDCTAPEGDRLVADGTADVYVERSNGATQTASQMLPRGDYGEDLELGPNGDPYALVGEYPEETGSRAGTIGTSHVFHLAQGTLALQPAADGSLALDGLPVDLAVDNHSRPLVWTQTAGSNGAGVDDWRIFRVVAGLTGLDTTWGTLGEAVVSDPRLQQAFGGKDNSKRFFLTVRPDDRVLATGGYQGQQGGRAAEDFDNGIIVGLTAGGKIDTAFAANGFKPFSFAAEFSSFERIGEPTLQSDGKVLIPHVTNGNNNERSARNRIASPPDGDPHVGVTRLGPPAGVSGVGAAETNNPPLRPSATPTICGRRAISLVRADVRGRRIKLTGLVGAALYGKRVTIQTDPNGARSSRFTRTTTVRASSSGQLHGVRQATQALAVRVDPLPRRVWLGAVRRSSSCRSR